MITRFVLLLGGLFDKRDRVLIGVLEVNHDPIDFKSAKIFDFQPNILEFGQGSLLSFDQWRKSELITIN